MICGKNWRVSQLEFLIAKKTALVRYRFLRVNQVNNETHIGHAVPVNQAAYTGASFKDS